MRDDYRYLAYYDILSRALLTSIKHVRTRAQHNEYLFPRQPLCSRTAVIKAHVKITRLGPKMFALRYRYSPIYPIKNYCDIFGGQRGAIISIVFYFRSQYVHCRQTKIECYSCRGIFFARRESDACFVPSTAAMPGEGNAPISLYVSRRLRAVV